MIGAVVDVDAIQLGIWAIPPNLKGRRLQDGRDISGTRPSKSASLYVDVERLRTKRHAIGGYSPSAVRWVEEPSENGEGAGARGTAGSPAALVPAPALLCV